MESSVVMTPILNDLVVFLIDKLEVKAKGLRYSESINSHIYILLNRKFL